MATVLDARQVDSRLAQRFQEALPFSFTPGQSAVMEEISTDLRSPHPMNRLLQGDVGSGKTVVAFAAMLLAIGKGGQAAMMAPTQILAEQHFQNARRWLEPLGVHCTLLTGSRKVGGDLPLFEDANRPQVLIGTHALLYEHGLFQDLRLIVIDEQHRFGVAQRALLHAGGQDPDVLVMTATPIPRTLAMAVYGDLDTSVILHKPEGRGTITTRVWPAEKEAGTVVSLMRQLDAGRQVYILCPLVEESEKIDASDVVRATEKWGRLLAPHVTAMLHGRMDAAEKERVMQAFRDGEIRVLVATTVIEVGIDVPNATVMVVLDAERFGLAQLHQLRGRVGRGAIESHCLLLTSIPMIDKNGKVPEESLVALARLRILEKNPDGFAIAEEDFKLRGPGDLLGTAQSGAPPLKIADLLKDGEILTTARHAACEILNENPSLEGVAYAHLRIAKEAEEVTRFSAVG